MNADQKNLAANQRETRESVFKIGFVSIREIRGSVFRFNLLISDYQRKSAATSSG